jgi:CRISPR-associated protein Cmr5
MTQRQTIEQKRAASAWNAVEDVKREFEQKKQKKYGSLVIGFAAMIQTNGLAVAVAFLLAKKGKAEDNQHAKLYNQLDTWLKDQLRYSQDKLIDFIHETSTDGYRRATAEAIEYVTWLKRYAEANDLKDEKGD